MENPAGKCKETAICIDDDDERQYRPAPKIAKTKPRRQPFVVTQPDNTKPANDDPDLFVLTDGGWKTAAQVAQEASQKRKEKREKNGHHPSGDGQLRHPTTRRERNSQREVILPAPPAVLDRPGLAGPVDEEDGIAPVSEKEQSNLDRNNPAAKKIGTSPSSQFPSKLPERTKVSQSPKVDSGSSKSAPSPSTVRQSISSTSQQPFIVSGTTKKPNHQSTTRASVSTSSTGANSSLHKSPANHVANNSKPSTVLLSNQKPSSHGSVRMDFTSGSAQDALETEPAQEGDGPRPPIGEIADQHRKQTTPRCVSNASTMEQLVEKLGKTDILSTNVRAAQSPRMAITHPKQRAMKSVKSRRPSSTIQPPPHQLSQTPAKELSISQGARQTSAAKKKRVGATVHDDQSLGVIAKSKAMDKPKPRFAGPGEASTSFSDGRIQEVYPTRTTPGQSSSALPTHSATSATRTIASSSKQKIPLSNNRPLKDTSNYVPRHNRETSLEVLIIDVTELNIARLAVETCLRQQLADRHESHAHLTGSQMWRQRTCYERELRAQHLRRVGLRPPSLPEKYVQTISPFKSMSRIQVPFKKKTSSGPHIEQEIFTAARPRDTVQSACTARQTMYKSDAIRIPSFKEYVFLRDNVLGDNESKLLATPYLQHDDDERHSAMVMGLPTKYEMIRDTNASTDIRNEQCRFYKSVVDSFLRVIGVSWDSILFWLLAPPEEIKRINSASPGWASFEEYLVDRSNYHLEEFIRDEKTQTAILFDRDSEKWKHFWAQSPSVDQCRLSAIACAAVHKECDFSIWYLARQSETFQEHVSKKTLAPVASSTLTFRDIVCRVCQQHDCILHGELRQVPEDSWNVEIGDKPAHFDDSDSDIERVINYKLPRNPDAFNIYPEAEMIESKGSNPSQGKFSKGWWKQRSYTNWEDRKPFFPCSHEGSCEHAKCRCFRENITCEKTCKCARNCQRRFPGCDCASKGNKRLCQTEGSCLCVTFKRECDSDLCGTCGATEILDPVNRFNEEVLKGRCSNVSIQRGVSRKTYLGHSELHGFGLYIGEDIQKDDYIGEYTGETISKEEGDRRSEIYHYEKTMYLFKLDEKQEVDATYMGNKLRFINNADEKWSNCAPKNLMCNTVFRLALYATENIKAGSELFFHYGYPKEHTKGFKQPRSAIERAAKKVGKAKAKAKASKPSTDKKPSSLPSRKRTSSRPLRGQAGKDGANSADESSNSHSKGPQKARKTLLPPGPRAIKTRGRQDDPDESHTSDSSSDDGTSLGSPDLQAMPEIQETDEEDEDFSLDEVQDSASEPGNLVADDEDTAFEDSDSVSMRSTRSTRSGGQRSASMAQVVAKKIITEQRAARKRKRFIANSDDE